MLEYSFIPSKSGEAMFHQLRLLRPVRVNFDPIVKYRFAENSGLNLRKFSTTILTLEERPSYKEIPPIKTYMLSPTSIFHMYSDSRKKALMFYEVLFFLSQHLHIPG